MKIFSILIFLLMAITSFSLQNNQDVIQYYEQLGYRKQNIDSLSHNLTFKHFYRDEIVESKITFDSSSGIVTREAYFLNGSIVYTVTLKELSLTGPFADYYYSGQLKRKGEYFNDFRTGEWTEYFSNGLKKCQGKYRMTEKDSLNHFKENNIDDKLIKNHVCYDTIIHGQDNIETNSFDVTENGVRKTIQVTDTLFIKDVWQTFLPSKDGIWKYWKSNGNLYFEEEFKNGILTRKKRY